MMQVSRAIPLLCVGRTRELSMKLGDDLAPRFTFPGIVDFDHYSPETIRVLIATLNPYPAGVLVGGGVSLEVQQEAQKVVEEQNAAGNQDLKYFCIPLGLRERVGAAALLEWVKDAFSNGFDVAW